MKITMSLFATLRRYAPGNDHVFDLPIDPGATLQQVVRGLGIPDTLHRITLINGRHGKPDQVLTDGDAVTLFPPITGG